MRHRKTAWAATMVLFALTTTGTQADPVEFQGHYYDLVCGSAITWADASAAAEASFFSGWPGHLAVVTSLEEHEFLTATFATIGTTDVWLGANDVASEGDWTWVTEEPWGSPNWGDTNWCSGEPNNSGNQDCLTYQSRASDCWDDLACETLGEVSCYLVEYEPFSLAVGGTCPSGISVDIRRATPEGTIAIGWSVSAGESTIPDDKVCAGTSIGLADPRLLVKVTADAGGAFSANTQVPVEACGLHVQALDLSSCSVSEAIQVPGE